MKSFTSAHTLSALLVSIATQSLLDAETVKPERVVLKNGATVLLLRVVGVEQLGIETFYDVGFMQEPAGMTQAAHLLEHLVCYGASKSFREKESFQRLNQIGMANAETLADWTHYDYMLPSDKLEMALQIEAERLTSVRFDQRLIQAEALRCYQETDAVQRNPASGMFKHAMMALAQAWRHRKTTALVRGGLEHISVADLTRFHQATYRPDNLTLIVVGDFEYDKAVGLVKKHIGAIPAPDRGLAKATAWDKVAKRQTVEWDAQLRSVCLAFPPPEDRIDSAVLSLFGSLVAQRLTTDSRLKEVVNMSICSHQQWKVGTLPFFVYAAAKDGQSLDDVETTLTDQFFSAVRQSQGALKNLPVLAEQSLAQITRVDRNAVEQQAEFIKRWRKLDQSKATSLVLGQTAINFGVLDRLLGPHPSETIGALHRLSPRQLREIVDKYLSRERMSVTHLVPFAGG